MAAPVPLRPDFDAEGLRALAKSSRDPAQTRRLLALSAIYAGGSRSSAAALGGVGLQTVWDWVGAFNAHGPDGLVDGKAPGARSRLDAERREALRILVEQGPISLKRAIADALLLRASTDFPDLTAYRTFVDELVGRCNARHAKRIDSERAVLGRLSATDGALSVILPRHACRRARRSTASTSPPCRCSRRLRSRRSPPATLGSRRGPICSLPGCRGDEAGRRPPSWTARMKRSCNLRRAKP